MRSIKSFIFRPLLAGIIIISTGCILIASLVYNISNKFIKTTLAEKKLNQIFIQSEKIQSGLYNFQNNLENYVIEPKPETETILKIYEKRILEDISTLMGYYSIHDPQRKETDSLNYYALKRFSYADSIIHIRNANKITIASKMLVSGERKYLLENTERLIKIIKDLEFDKLSNEQIKNKAGLESFNYFLTVIFLSLALSGVVIIFQLYKNLKQKEKQEEDDRYMNLLMQNISDALVSTDENFRIRTWNNAAELIYGFKAGISEGKDVIDAIDSPTPLEERIKTRLQIRETGHWSGEVIYKDSRGKEIVMLSAISAIHNAKGKRIGYISSNRDVTERIQAEKALAQTQALLQTIVDNYYAPIFAKDRNGSIILWNKACEQMTSVPRAAAIGKTVYDFFDKATSDRWNSNENEIMETGIAKSHEEVILSPSAEQTFLSTIFPLISEQGEVFGTGGINVNITDRKRLESDLRILNKNLEEEVRKKTAELSEIFQRISDGFAATDNSLKFTYANPRAAEMVQRDISKIIGKNIFELFPNLINTKLPELLHEARVDQVKSQMEYHSEILGKWFELDIYPSKNGISFFIRDISARKIAELALMESEQKYRDLVEQASDGIFITNLEGQYLEVNSSASRLTGYSRKELISMKIADLISPGDLNNNPLLIERLKQGRSSLIERKLMHKDGREIDVEISAKMLPYGKLLGIVRDITEKKKTEKALKKSHERFQLFAKATNDAMWDWDLETYESWWNENHYKLYGIKSDADPLSWTDWKERIHPEDQESIVTSLETCLNNQAPYWEKEYRFRLLDGAYADLLDRIYIIYRDGKPIRMIGTLMDVTERKKSETLIRETSEQLRELSAHLQNIREDERLHIAREIHDELGQLLTVLKMDVSWIGKKLKDSDESIKSKISEIISILDKTVKSVRRIATELRPSILDDLGLQAAMEWQAEEFQEKTGIPVDIQINLSEDKISDSSGISLFRIFQESLTNIARHANAEKVEVLLEEGPDELLMTISDNGMGFDESSIDKKRTLGILGMKERALMTGGNYRIESVPGRGTTIYIRIPIQSPNINNASDQLMQTI